jgi:ABC-type Zn uptake system ZnuABC Zn-binding protein ZnuA
VGINEQDGQIPFSVFPNPTKGNISISINKAMSDASLVIYNSLGAKTYSDKISGSGNRTLELKIDEPPGIYFLEIKDETNRFIQKIIMQANE